MPTSRQAKRVSSRWLQAASEDNHGLRMPSLTKEEYREMLRYSSGNSHSHGIETSGAIRDDLAAGGVVTRLNYSTIRHNKSVVP